MEQDIPHGSCCLQNDFPLPCWDVPTCSALGFVCESTSPSCHHEKALCEKGPVQQLPLHPSHGLGRVPPLSPSPCCGGNARLMSLGPDLCFNIAGGHCLHHVWHVLLGTWQVPLTCGICRPPPYQAQLILLFPAPPFVPGRLCFPKARGWTGAGERIMEQPSDP